MKIETIGKNHKKEIIIGVSIFVVIAIVLVVKGTLAKYELVKNIKIAEGTINYKQPDFKMMAMYKNDGNGDIKINTMPESGYTINESKSYCTLDNINKDNKAKLYTDENGQHIISGLSKSSKCYLYFDKELCKGTACKTILGNITVKDGTPDFSKVATTDEGVYKAQDDDGDTYYYRGAVENNYLKFADKYWRIVRINGNGSIRLIYDGAEPNANGAPTSNNTLPKSVLFNINCKSSECVGFKYTAGQVHGLGTKSNVLTQLETWYQNNLSSYTSKIDINAGFCGDRTPSTSATEINNQGGTGATYTYYGANIRLKSDNPILICPHKDDLYTVASSIKGNKSLDYPIGLLTADESIMAGGNWGQGIKNTSYYLYNSKFYWLITPGAYGNKISTMFGITNYGYITQAGEGGYIRPVINISADNKITGTGTISNPYVVS